MAAAKDAQANDFSVISARQATCIILALGGYCSAGVFYCSAGVGHGFRIRPLFLYEKERFKKRI